MGISAVRVFASAIDQMQSSAKNLEAIQEARRKRKMEDEKFDLEKKKSEIDIEEKRQSGLLTQEQIKNQQVMRDATFKNKKAIYNGQDALIDQTEHEQAMTGQQAQEVAKQAYPSALQEIQAQRQNGMIDQSNDTGFNNGIKDSSNDVGFNNGMKDQSNDIGFSQKTGMFSTTTPKQGKSNIHKYDEVKVNKRAEILAKQEIVRSGQNLSLFMKSDPDKYAELVKKYTAPAADQLYPNSAHDLGRIKSSNGGYVNVTKPDGTQGRIKAEFLDEAIAAGYTKD